MMRVLTRLIQSTAHTPKLTVGQNVEVRMGLKSTWWATAGARVEVQKEKGEEKGKELGGGGGGDKSRVVLMHMVSRARTLPSPSPFVLKLWTYMNITQIPYKIDTKKPFGAKGLSPWITLDGEDIADSQIIVQTLGKKFDINLGKVYTAEELAVSRAARIMMEDHFLWGGIGYWRVNDGLETVKNQVFKLKESWAVNAYFQYVFVPRWRKQGWIQGMGRHSKEDIQEFMTSDLRALSALLGKKKFILGPTPCEDDCAIFGVLAQIYWGSPGSPYERLIKEELRNLGDYCERIKGAYWPNWDKELAR